MEYNGEVPQASADEGAGTQPVCGGGNPRRLALQGQSVSRLTDTGLGVHSNSSLSLLVQLMAGRCARKLSKCG